MISMPASPALSLEIEDEEETNQRKLEQAKMDSDHAIALFKLFPYDNKTKKNITAARKLFGGHLCIDRLLTFAGVEIGSLYPPSNEGQLKKLICAIYECDLDQIKKDSIVYYLIRECQDNTIINSFIQSRSIPLPYQQAITGYWLLDHERYKESITWLCMPTVSVDWPDDVLAILCQSQLYNLAEQFIQMRQWKPSCLTGVQRLFDTLLHTDLLQALLLQVIYDGYNMN
ncbi:nuclear pore complex assembly-domain-containing protein [Syncephalis fuscata]|nr:nuclear pore complex assembly-domain-containing protein [Syncephalis fuscata]